VKKVFSKGDVDRLLAEQRVLQKEKQLHSQFMLRSLTIYNGQKKRAADAKTVLQFTIEEFRSWLLPRIGTICECGVKITLKNLAVDHVVPIARGGAFDLANLNVLCKSSNFRKGQLLPDEFDALCAFAREKLSAESREDLWRRLTLGGKWTRTLGTYAR